MSADLDLGWYKRLAKSERGSVLIIGALSLAAVIGMLGLAVDLGNGYMMKGRNQRVADMAALAGAVAYQGSSQSLAAAQASATDVVLAHGLPASSATISQVTVNSAAALQVTITTAQPIMLARLLSSAVSFNVAASGTASLTGNNTAACIIAMNPLVVSGIAVTGGTSLTGSNCAITSNSAILSDNPGAKITAKQIVGSSIIDAGALFGQAAVTTAPTARNIQTRPNAASDPLASDSSVKAALCQVNKLTRLPDLDYPDGNTSCTSALILPVASSPSGAADWNLTYQPRSAGGIYAYQTADYSCNYQVPAGAYTIGKLTVGGGCSITFLGTSTLRFDAIDMSGSGLTIGDGPVTVVGTFGLNSGSLVTIGNGAHSFGSLNVTGGRTLQIGSGNLNVVGAITEDGGSRIYVNATAGNTVVIGNNGLTTAISVAGGSYLCFTPGCAYPAAATGGFSANGSITTGGGSTLIINMAVTHVVNGDLSLNGNSTFGSGLYVIKGLFSNNTGGTMAGTSVTFALGGSLLLSGGTSLDLAAPSGSNGYGIPDVLVVTKTLLPTVIGGGSQDSYSGVIDAPHSALAMTGGSSISSSGSSCLMAVFATFALTGSASLTGRNCPTWASQSGSSGSVVLVQ